jgi:hypothetical protein
MSTPWLTRRDFRQVSVFGVVRPGVTLTTVRSELNGIATQMHVEHAESYVAARGFGMAATSLLEELTGPARETLVLLLATSGFVLLIACANVANLTLVRLVHRRGELVVRAALGAGSRRLARQLLTESVVVAIAGAPLVSGSRPRCCGFSSRTRPVHARAFEIGLDAPVLLVTLGVSIVVGIVSGTLPLLTVTRDLSSGLRGRGDVSQSGARRGRAERLLVVGQVAASVILLAAAGLSVRSMIALSRIDTGYRSEQVLSVRFTPSRERYTNGAAPLRARPASIHRHRTTAGRLGSHVFRQRAAGRGASHVVRLHCRGPAGRGQRHRAAGGDAHRDRHVLQDHRCSAAERSHVR